MKCTAAKIFLLPALMAWLLVGVPTTRAQEYSETLQISAGENLSAISQLNGVLIDPRWSPALALLYRNNNFFIDSENGIGFEFFHNEPIHVGTMLDYQYGRRAGADGRYRGMGNVDSAIAPAVFIEWEPVRDAIDIYLNTSKGVSGSSGWLYKLEFTGGFPLALNKSLYVDIIWNAGNSSYAQAYYGVSSAQSKTSGYSTYSPGNGLLTINTVLGFEYRPSKKLSIDTQIGQLRYLDQAVNSPIIDSAAHVTAGVFTTYQY